MNEDTSLEPFRGRVVVHVFSELVTDLLPSFCFNTTTRRYVRGPVQFVPPPPRDSMPKFHSHYWYTARFNKAFNDVLKLTRGDRIHPILYRHSCAMVDVVSQNTSASSIYSP